MNLKKRISKYIGTKQFYQAVIFVGVPIIVQNVITNFVSLLDNIMVGRVGTEQMSGVSIVNQLVFVFMLAVFGLFSGIGIYGAQFYGNKDNEGLKYTFRIKLISGTILLLAAIVLLKFFGDELILSYIHDGEAGLNLESTFNYAKSYLDTAVWGLPPFIVTQLYSTSLKETQNTKAPMIAGLCAVFVNLFLNWVLIYGKLGAPVLGVVGAAIATNIARVIECLICIIWAHKHTDIVPFMKGIYSKLTFPKGLVKDIVVTALPLFINEVLWSSGQTFQNQIMSLRGLEVVSALNISSTASNIFGTLFISMGESISILVGNAQGTGDVDLVIDTDRKLIALDLVIGFIVGFATYLLAPLFVLMYNTGDIVKSLATTFIKITAVYMPFQAGCNAFYHTIRSGGKTLITFLLDSCFVWTCAIPVALVSVYKTDLTIVPVYALIFGTNILKALISFIGVKKRIWINDLSRKIK